MQAVFEEKKALFEGLYIYDKVDWEQQYPVLKLDMSRLSTEFIETFGWDLNTYLDGLAMDLGCTVTAPTASGRLLQLIDQLYHKTGRRVVALIDKYDKPIQDVLQKPELAATIREILRNFYTILKKQSAKPHFVFLTGV